ncbi:MAG TPA: hypothetical protein RMF84_02225 [Polyangiaceae bacterium LLY-WYZ-14_1]|nr:hypothetical protein [Polyangiaceae bacterium LLY-WYZ-14_1]
MPQATCPREEEPVVLSWSTGKDSAWTLRMLRDRGVRVEALLTSCNVESSRVTMHGVPTELLEAQARSLGLPLVRVDLPSPCSNEDYELAMVPRLRSFRDDGVLGIVFGDLLLVDVRRYRERQVAAVCLTPWFPLFGSDTGKLARAMIRDGLRAVVTCVDPRRCPAELTGAEFDERFLEMLPDGVDPCGENGEFHTFAYDGPGFREPIPVRSGSVVERDGFLFADLLPGFGEP